MVQHLGSSSYWHETSPHVPGPVLRGHREVDVAIVGGGFTGLWTAYQLREADPSLKVAVIEREVIGFGASGRNGGFAMTLLDMSLAHLRRNHGDEAATGRPRAVATSVQRDGCHIDQQRASTASGRHGGLMVVATNRPNMERIEADLVAAEATGPGGLPRLRGPEAQAEVHSPTYVGGLREDALRRAAPGQAGPRPGRVVERARCATCFERTDVTGIDEVGRPDPHHHSARGAVDAEQVVLATNAWASQTDPGSATRSCPSTPTSP